MNLLPLEAYGEYAAECSDSESSDCLPSCVASPTLNLKRQGNPNSDEIDGQSAAKRICSWLKDHGRGRSGSHVAKSLSTSLPVPTRRAQLRQAWFNTFLDELYCRPASEYEELGDQLGDSIVNLFEYLNAGKHEIREAFLPEAARDAINSATEQKLPDSCFFPGTHPRLPSVDLGDSIDIIAEQRQLSRIIAEAGNCAGQGCVDEAWNIKVRGPLLALALRPFRNTRYEPLTPEWVKMPYNSDPRSIHKRGRMPVQLEGDGAKVTFALVPDSPGLANSVKEKLSKLELSERRVNHLLYRPLRNLPIGCLVETSPRTVSRHRVDEWGVGIGYHMTALQRRLDWYMDSKYPEEEDWVDSPELVEGYPPDLPVRLGIYVSGHDWYLYAVGRNYLLQMTNGVHIGNTNDLLAAYQLLNVLREIGNYINGTYYPWMLRFFSGDWHVT